MKPTLQEALAAYREQFGDAPSVEALPQDREAKAAEVLIAAVESNKAFESDAAFYEALGLDRPADGQGETT
jgi:hypothetical protein